MDTALITVPTIWDANRNTKQNGKDIAVEAIRAKEELQRHLVAGFSITATTSFVFNDVAYIQYVLERK